MPASLSACAPLDTNAQPSPAAEPPLYPDDLLPEMQGVLAALADIETRHEIERERLEQGPQAEDEKQPLLTVLVAGLQHQREPLVQRLAQLQNRMPHRTESQPATASPEIREAMLAAIPSLRAFAISLACDVETADDLVQDTILRAWANLDRFQGGTSMRAWLFTILRNSFLTQCRRGHRQVQDPDGMYAARLGAPPKQNAKCDFSDFRTALASLSVEHREALILIGAEGLSYEEAAQVCGVGIGTVKSRVHRGRVHLAELLALEEADDLGLDRATQAALQSTF